jgi:hypothetical protein
VALIERMDKIAAPVEALQKLWSMASAGDMTALRVWLEYRYGKPRQAVDTIMAVTWAECLRNVRTYEQGQHDPLMFRIWLLFDNYITLSQ